jgi:hypothetical protein
MADSATADLDRLMRGLLEYQRTRSKLTWQEVLEKKGRDLGIKLSEATKDRQWGGSGGGKGIAEAEMRARARGGRGTLLRKSLADEYAARAAAAKSAAGRVLGGSHMNRISTRGMTKEAQRQIAAIRKAESRRFNGRLRQEFVGKEVGLRQRGIGVLAVGWLWYRRKKTRAGTTFVLNRTGRKLGYVHIGENTLRMVNVQAGIGEVVERYGIVRKGVNTVLRDMDVYMAQKQGRAIGLTLLEQGLPTILSTSK